MKMKRLWWTVRLLTIRGGAKRANYARKAGIYAHIGENVSIQSRVVPIYSELIKFHNNIAVARNVDFVTHDIMHRVFNRLPDSGDNEKQFSERVGCIEIMDNVFVGSNSIILYGTKIGPNVIIASGSVVTKDCEPNAVYGGVPAKKIGNFDEFIKRRMENEKSGRLAVTNNNQSMTQTEILTAWDIFNNTHLK